MNPIASRSFAGHSLTFGFDSDIYLLEFRNSLIAVGLGAEAAMRSSVGIAAVDPRAEKNLLQVGKRHWVVGLNTVHVDRRPLLQIAQDVAQRLLFKNGIRNRRIRVAILTLKVATGIAQRGLEIQHLHLPGIVVVVLWGLRRRVPVARRIPWLKTRHSTGMGRKATRRIPIRIPVIQSLVADCSVKNNHGRPN